MKQALNFASILLSDRQLLLESSRKQVDESGFVYKKGKSRRKLNPTSPTKKRKKISQSFRVQRLTELQERIKELSDHIGYKQKCLDQANNSQNYKQCDELSEQISALKGDRRKLEAEQKALIRNKRKISCMRMPSPVPLVLHIHQLRWSVVTSKFFLVHDHPPVVSLLHHHHLVIHVPKLMAVPSCLALMRNNRHLLMTLSEIFLCYDVKMQWWSPLKTSNLKIFSKASSFNYSGEAFNRTN